MKEFKTFGLSCLSTKKEKKASGICYLYQVVSKKKSQMRPAGIDQKCHLGGSTGNRHGLIGNKRVG